MTIRESKPPDEWRTFEARSLLGAAMFGQQKYAEAELLLAGYFDCATYPDGACRRRGGYCPVDLYQ